MDSECDDYLWRALTGNLTPEEQADHDRMRKMLEEWEGQPELETPRDDPEPPRR